MQKVDPYRCSGDCYAESFRIICGYAAQFFMKISLEG
jgi:hypothetical protein